VGHVRAGVEAIEKDKDLTPDARKRKRHELARQTMTQLEKLPSMEKARQSVAAITAKWQEKIDGALTRPNADDAATALLLREVRDKFANLKDQQDRMKWIEKFGHDPLVPSALLNAPAGLTGLSEAQRALLQSKAEALADPKIVEAKSKVTRALVELERSYRAAPALVAQCAGLDKAIAARPLPSKPELAAPKGDMPPKANTPKANGPNWPSTHSSSPATASGPNWT